MAEAAILDAPDAPVTDPAPFRLLVTGSRTWNSPEVVRNALIWAWRQDAGEGPLVVVHGAARGADSHARAWALAMGRHGYPVTQEGHPVTDRDWDRYGKRAGFVRNEAMVAAGASLMLAFILPCELGGRCRRSRPHGTHGAEHCARRAAEAGINVRRING